MRTEMESGNFNGSYYKHQLHRTRSVTKPCETRDKRDDSSKGASFIKILCHDSSKQLQLPEDFTMNMNGYIPHRFIIESSITKKCWRVEIETDEDGRMHFSNGWSDFVEAHSLEVGDILHFEYEEQSIFQVRIYNRNGCERTVLLHSTTRGECKPKKTNDDEDGEDIEDLELEPVIVKCREPKTRRLAPRTYTKGMYKRWHAVPRSYTRTAKVSATENKICFSVTIHPYKKYQFPQMTIPKEISQNLKLRNKDKVKLQNAQGKSWIVKLLHRKDGRSIFTRGWMSFMKDNKVSPRDKLQIEFISDELIQVLVTKSSKVDRESDEERDEATGSFNGDCKS